MVSSALFRTCHTEDPFVVTGETLSVLGASKGSTMRVACFAAMTVIKTEMEKLAVGDRVATAGDRSKLIVSIEQRAGNCQRHPVTTGKSDSRRTVVQSAP